MRDQTSSEYRYWAFISYSSQDRSWARWLHKSIERYGIPARYVRHQHRTLSGEPAPKRFYPLFLDRDELPASSDLGNYIQNALKSSRYLIVVCSPHAAYSKWVDKEIETFQNMGRKDRIFAIIVDGEPNAGDETECFPPTFKKEEPIAADARKKGDGKADARLKLLSGMLGVGFDELKRRDQIRLRRKRVFLLLISMIVLIPILLLWFKMNMTGKLIPGYGPAYPKINAARGRMNVQWHDADSDCPPGVLKWIKLKGSLKKGGFSVVNFWKPSNSIGVGSGKLPYKALYIRMAASSESGNPELGIEFTLKDIEKDEVHLRWLVLTDNIPRNYMVPVDEIKRADIDMDKLELIAIGPSSSAGSSSGGFALSVYGIVSVPLESAISGEFMW